MHENDAAEVLYRMTANEHMHPSDVKEGKIEVIADTECLLKVDREETEESKCIRRDDESQPDTAIP